MTIVEFRAGRLEIATFAERPELRAGVFEAEIQSAVPEFMRHDPAAALYYDDGNLDHYRDYGLVAVDPSEPDRPVARAFSVPFGFPDPARGREALPHGGWDRVIRWAHRDRLRGVQPTAVSALEIMVAPRLQGQGVSQMMRYSGPFAPFGQGAGNYHTARRHLHHRSAEAEVSAHPEIVRLPVRTTACHIFGERV